MASKNPKRLVAIDGSYYVSSISGLAFTLFKQMDTVKITKHLFNKYNFTLMGDLNLGRYMSCCIMYRGNVVPKEINATIHILKRFVDRDILNL